MTRVKTRDVIVVAGGLLIVIGFVPKIAALAQLVPGSVLGGAMVALFGMVISSGIRIIGTQVDLNRHENLFIIACSIGMGLGVTVVPQLFAGAPAWAQIMLGNGIIAGSFTAIFMNLLFNGLGSKETAAQLAAQHTDEMAQENTKTA